MLRLTVLALALAATSDSRPVQRTVADAAAFAGMSALPVQAGGRVERKLGGFRHQWPGVYFEAAFRGDRVSLRFDDATNAYRASIDGSPPQTIDRPGTRGVTFAGLGGGAHRIRLDKVTESAQPAWFGGFFVAPGRALPAPPPRRRQIEFIGDSSMTGYGARSPGRACSPEQVRATTDTPNAFAALAARHYGADYQVNAVSGLGLMRGLGAGDQRDGMERIWPRSMPAEPAPYADPTWQPQIVMLKLQADFIGFRPDTRWPSMDALLGDYATRYGRFLARLHARYPGAVFLLWWFDGRSAPPEEQARLRAAEARISDAARTAGARDVLFLPFPAGAFRATACHGHYGLEEHRRIAAWLIHEIDAHPEFWAGR